MKFLPKINAVYWACIAIASIFGANVGDYLSDGLGLGNLAGLPYEAVALAAVFAAERFLPRSALYFWVAVAIIRAAATNVGDALHTFNIGWEIAVPASAVLLALCVVVWRTLRRPEAGTSFIPINGFYWLALFLAGIFGTVAGDAMSYGLHLGNLWAAVVTAIPAAFLLVAGRKRLVTKLGYYWLVVALIRTAGTAAGDFAAHNIGLTNSTVVSGVVYFGLVILAYLTTDTNLRVTRRSTEPGQNSVASLS